MSIITSNGILTEIKLANFVISIFKSEYVRSLPKEQQFGECPFINICGENKKLMPPKSISIMGQTGWTSAYTKQDEGGGGLMA